MSWTSLSGVLPIRGLTQAAQTTSNGANSVSATRASTQGSLLHFQAALRAASFSSQGRANSARSSSWKT